MLRNFPPADQCSDQDIEDLVLAADANWSDARELAESPAHVAKVCAWALKQGNALYAARSDLDAARRTISAMECALAAATNDLDSARTEIKALTDTLDAERNERQAEVLQAGADRERADEAEAAAEVFEATARAVVAKSVSLGKTEPATVAEIVHAVDGRLSLALAREKAISAAFSAKLEDALRQLEQHQQTLHHNDRIQSALAVTYEAVTGKTIEQVNLELDEELAAHPDIGPLHHARDQREPEETTP